MAKKTLADYKLEILRAAFDFQGGGLSGDGAINRLAEKLESADFHSSVAECSPRGSMSLQQACDILNWERYGGDLIWFPVADGNGGACAFGMSRDSMVGAPPIPAADAVRIACEFRDRRHCNREAAKKAETTD